MEKDTRPEKEQFTIFNLDFDLDFDLSDFDLIDAAASDLGFAPEPQQRILRPRIAKDDEVFHRVMFQNAEAFADQIDLTPGSRTFAWLSGNFIFGDVIEAMVSRRNARIKDLYIASLSMSRENIDSIKNVMLMLGEDLEKVVMVISGYLYSHEKFDLIPYMYQELDDGTDRVQIAFGGWHTKIITFDTVFGHTMTLHGSANLRSSNSVEQVMVEIDNRELHEFNAHIMQGIADKFGTINHKAPLHRLKRIEGVEAYELSRRAAEE